MCNFAPNPRARECGEELSADHVPFCAGFAAASASASGTLQGIDALESALQASPATIVTAEPFLFNLCEYNYFRPRCLLSHLRVCSPATLYELRSTAGVDKKRELLIEVARWAGDGLRTTCLKMPTN